MASASANDGTLLVATDRALHLGGLRLPWDRVARATWDADDRVLLVVASAAAGERTGAHRVEVDDGRRLLEAVRTMVTSSVVVSERVEQRGGGAAAWVTARRDPDADELRWTVVFDPGLDPRDPSLRAWADEQVAAIRRVTGV